MGRPKTRKAIIEGTLKSPFVSFAVGGVLLVLGWKMNSAWANLILVLAWAAFVVGAFRAPGKAWKARILCAVIAAAVSGGPIYYFLWTPPVVELSVSQLNSLKKQFGAISGVNVFINHQAHESMDGDTLYKVNHLVQLLESTGHQAIPEPLSPGQPRIRGVEIEFFVTAGEKTIGAFTAWCDAMNITPKKITKKMGGNDIRITIGPE